MLSLFDTLEYTLKRHNKVLSDIEWVGSADLEMPLENFIELAKKTDDSYYKQIDPIDLIVVGNDFIVKREFSDHDDNEFWFYINTMKPEIKKQLITFDSDELTQEELKKAFLDVRNKEDEYDPRFFDKPISFNGNFYSVNFTKLWMLKYKN